MRARSKFITGRTLINEKPRLQTRAPSRQMRRRQNHSGTVAILLTVLASACGGSSTTAPRHETPAAPEANRGPVSLDKNSYPVFPNADAGADPSVPAEQGGKGFKGE